jgi:hypothetical protein
MGGLVSARNLSDDGLMTVPDLPTVADYLRSAGWSLEDQDARTSLWRATVAQGNGELEIVLPTTQDVSDYADRISAALRTLAYAERRLPDEITSDMSFGGADTVAVRMSPDAPPGEAPLPLARSAVEALHTFVLASAVALQIHELVLPSYRPPWAESYASRVRLSTHPGSFILSLALPLVADVDDDRTADDATGTEEMFRLPPQPLGRQVSGRMLASAQAAQQLAEEVSAGNRPLEAFGDNPGRPAVNATELAALKALGGPSYGLYQLRFTQSPLAGRTNRRIS